MNEVKKWLNNFSMTQVVDILLCTESINKNELKAPILRLQ